MLVYGFWYEAGEKRLFQDILNNAVVQRAHPLPAAVVVQAFYPPVTVVPRYLSALIFPPLDMMKRNLPTPWKIHLFDLSMYQNLCGTYDGGAVAQASS